MNYLKIYNQIMVRAKTENRKKGGVQYYEKHHIVPDFMFKTRSRKGPAGHLPGDVNDPENLVLLTMREHIIAHVLLAKAFEGKRYWAQSASSLILMIPKEFGKHIRQNKTEWAKLSRKFAKHKEMGARGISAARKGTFPAVDTVTGENMGSVRVDHPNVLSGKWVHHSKGKPATVTNKTLAWRKTCSGDTNKNARCIDTDYIKQRLREFDVIVRTQFDGKFLKVHCLRWFDTLQHDCVFYKFRTSQKQLPQLISGLSGEFLDIKKLAKEVSLENNYNWLFPIYGCGRYSKVIIK